MNDNISKLIEPGTAVEVTQQIPHGKGVWTRTVSGTVLSHQQQPTGSWFAHARGDKLWLDRLVIRRDDGEVSVLNLDQYSVIKRSDQAPRRRTPGE